MNVLISRCGTEKFRYGKVQLEHTQELRKEDREWLVPEITQENENIEPEAQPETEHTEHIEAHIETLAHTEPEHIQQMQQEVSEESIHIHVQEANSVNDETDVAMSDLMVSSLEGVSIPTVGRKKRKNKRQAKGEHKDCHWSFKSQKRRLVAVVHFQQNDMCSLQ